MGVIKALGLQFRLQRFITIANYKLPGESFVHIIARIIPFAIITTIAFIDIVDMMQFGRPSIKGMVTVPIVVNKIDKIVMKGGVIFIAILAFRINRNHLCTLKCIDAYDESIRKYQKRNIKYPLRFVSSKRSNIEFYISFIVNGILCLNLYLMTAINAPPKQALFHTFFVLLMSIHDFTILYISNVIRLFGCHEPQLVQMLQDNSSRHNFEVLTLIDGFSSTIGMINKAFGSLTFFTFVQHLIGGIMTSYLLFWLIFVGPNFEFIIPFILSAAAYNIRMTSYIIHLSVVGESIPRKIENLRCQMRRWMQSDELCLAKENWVVGGKTNDGENFVRAVKFNSQQLLLKYLHQETHVSASEYFTINNSAICATFGALITYLMVLIQFQELEQAQLEQEI